MAKRMNQSDIFNLMQGLRDEREVCEAIIQIGVDEIMLEHIHPRKREGNILRGIEEILKNT